MSRKLRKGNTALIRTMYILSSNTVKLSNLLVQERGNNLNYKTMTTCKILQLADKHMRIIEVTIKPQAIIPQRSRGGKNTKKQLLGIKSRTAGYAHQCYATELILPQSNTPFMLLFLLY